MPVETNTPSSTALATTLVTSSSTGAAFGLGSPQSQQGTTSLGTSVTSKNPIASQRIIYGFRGQVGGTITYACTSKTTFAQQQNGVTDSDNGNLHMVITFSGHQIAAFGGGQISDINGTVATVPLFIYLDGYQVPLTVNAACMFGGDFGSWTPPTDGGYYVPADFSPPNLASGKADTKHDYRWRVRVEIDLGDPTNSSQPFPLLFSDAIGNPGTWTATCLQQGCAKAHVQLIWDNTRFANGVPQCTFDISGRLVLDPRLSPPALVFSTNSALCLYDFLMDTKFGLSVDPSMLDTALVVAAANSCDESMVLREGGTQPRYVCSGVVEASAKRGEVVQKILDSMAGTLVPPGDLWKMYAGAWSDSVLSITDSDLRGPIKIDTTVSRKDLCNAVKGTFISPANNYQSSDYPPYVNAGYVEADGGTITYVEGLPVYSGVTYEDLALDFVTDPVQAQRLAKIRVEQIRAQCPLVLQCTMMAFPAEVNDVITFTHERWGLAAATYKITHTAIVLDDSKAGPILGYDLVCIPFTAEAYAWDADVDEGTVVICTAPLLPDNQNVGAPTDLVLESDSSTTIIRADGIAHSQIKVSWTAPTDATVLLGGYIEVFIEQVGTDEYFLAGTAQGAQTSYFIDTNIIDGTFYNVMIQSLNAAGSHSSGLYGTVMCSGSASAIGGSSPAPGPLNVVNNDFEVSSALPPAGWVVTGDPTLSFDISSEQQGNRSLIVASSAPLDGVYTLAKYEVVPGDMWDGEQYKVGGFMKGDGVSRSLIAFRFFDKTDTEVGPPVLADADATSPPMLEPTPAEWAFYSAVGSVPSTAVYGRVFLQNDTSATSVEFDSIVLFRLASMEDEVVDGPSRGAITAANSSYRPLTNPLTAVDDGFSGSPPLDYSEIDIAAFQMLSSVGPVTMNVNSGVISGLQPATVYHVYYDDPTYMGGAVTYYANQLQIISLDGTGRFYVGSIRTPSTGALPTIGNNDGGTGAQSGQLYMLSPTLRNDLDIGGDQPNTWYPASYPDTDGDTTTYFDMNVADTIFVSGIPTPVGANSKWTDLKLKVRSEVLSVTPSGAAAIDWSLDDGQTWTGGVLGGNFFNVVYGSDVDAVATVGANAGSGSAWTNPANITQADNYATLTSVAHGLTSQNLQATGFGFDLAAGSVIDGITVSFDELDSGAAETGVNAEQGLFTVQLLKAGSPVGDAKTLPGAGTSTPQFGNNTDLWETTWSVSDINNSNFGFELAAVTPSLLDAWTATTYFSPNAVIIDSNGNFQLLEVAGTSGATAPTWATTLGAATTDGTNVWALYQFATSWTAGTIFSPGDPTIPPGPANTPTFITANAGGTNCVFELCASTQPQLGNLIAYCWPTGNKGEIDIVYPIGETPTANVVNTNINSLHWWTHIEPWSGSTDNMYWYPVNADGTVGTTGFDLLFNQAWQTIVLGQINFPAPGIYNFSIEHDDGTLIAFDPSMCSLVTGTVTNVACTLSPAMGFPWMCGDNNSGSWQDFFSIKVFAAGPIQFELGYINWEHSGHLRVTCQDSTGTYQELIPVSTPLETGATAPVWPAWATSLAPSWPSVTEPNGFVWVNRGPVTDFAWAANKGFTAAGTAIQDSNGDKEISYRAGYSSFSQPSWPANGYTTDGASLIWRNVGGFTAATDFNFSVRNARIDVAFLPPDAENTRPATTDELSLPLTQNLAAIQVRYTLDVGGDMRIYEVWAECQMG